MNTRIAMAVGAIAASGALGSITITYGESPAPTYSTTLNFDEPGGAVGAGVASDSWSSIGISSLMAGDGFNRVLNLNSTPGFGWLPDNNVFVGGFGVFLNFSDDVTDFSAQVWDNAGPASPFGGGVIVDTYNDGAFAGGFIIDSPTFGPSGPTWLNISGTEGMVFDEVRIVGLAFAAPETIVDNISYNLVPAPSGLALLGAMGLATTRRRR